MVFATELGIESDSHLSFLSPAPFSINGFAGESGLWHSVLRWNLWNLAAGVLPLKPAGGGAESGEEGLHLPKGG